MVGSDSAQVSFLSPLSSQTLTFKENTTCRQHNTKIPLRQKMLQASLSIEGIRTTFALRVAKRNSNNTQSNMRANRAKGIVSAQATRALEA